MCRPSALEDIEIHVKVKQRVVSSRAMTECFVSDACTSLKKTLIRMGDERYSFAQQPSTVILQVGYNLQELAPPTASAIAMCNYPQWMLSHWQSKSYSPLLPPNLPTNYPDCRIL